jgi:mannosyl-glycoprotein endo-beta-N-acetylglucosaminidase
MKSNELFGLLQSDVALKAAREAGVSSALFAPGWVYETEQPPDFKTAQNRFLPHECPLG